MAFLKDFDRAGDDGEDVVEIMGDAAGELPDRIHLLGLTQPFLGLVLVGHVGGRAAIAHEAPVGGKYRPAVDADVALPPGRCRGMLYSKFRNGSCRSSSRDMLTPFLRLGSSRSVAAIEAALADQAQPRSMPKSPTRSET